MVKFRDGNYKVVNGLLVMDHPGLGDSHRTRDAAPSFEPGGDDDFEGDPEGGPYDPDQFGVERMADGKFRIRRRRRNDRRAHDAMPYTIASNATPQQQQARLRAHNESARRYWDARR